MKKSFRSIAFFLALSASFAAVLHSSHLDAGHLQSASSHQCGLCQTVRAVEIPTVTVATPVFAPSYVLGTVKPVVTAIAAVSNADTRGPPLA